ncbi:MAG: SH3 domain-containing protein [Sporomusaceae bacterium]|nr:SH3 domain-containing protein [Sporomusaceae bacterium]
MNNLAFWLKKHPDAKKTGCSTAALAQINRETRSLLPDTVFDLSQYPAYIAAAAVAGIIRDSATATAAYVNGVAAEPDYGRRLQQSLNLQALEGMIQVGYGITLRRVSLRTFPTDDFAGDTADDREFDQFQETTLNPAEPLICLHHSFDRRWLFVQAGNYRGWAEAAAIAVSADRALWLRYSQAADFLVVTGNQLRLGEDPHLPEFAGLSFAMGAKLPLCEASTTPAIIGNRALIDCYAVLLPTAAEGPAFRPVLIPKAADVHRGYLPCSRANLLRQAFKLQGDRYGWGGMFGSRDCSALIQDVFRSVGIFLARNAGDQARGAGSKTDFSGKGLAERQELLRRLPPAATLHFPGHVMLYLGEQQNRFYVLHAIAACGDPQRPQADGTLARLPLNGIMVTDLSLPRLNGKSLLESLTTANCLV